MSPNPVVISSLIVAIVYVVIVLPERELHRPSRLFVVTLPSAILSYFGLLTDSVPISALSVVMIPLFALFYRARDLNQRLSFTARELSHQIEELQDDLSANEDKVVTLYETTMGVAQIDLKSVALVLYRILYEELGMVPVTSPERLNLRRERIKMLGILFQATLITFCQSETDLNSLMLDLNVTLEMRKRIREAYRRTRPTYVT